MIRITAAPVSAWRRASTDEHLRLHGDVEGRRRLVGDDELRAPGHRHGDHGPLAHAAGELVRILPRASGRIGDVDLAQKLDRARAGVARREAAMRDLAFGDLASDRQHRVQRRRRVLEDEADILGRACAAGVSASRRRLPSPTRTDRPLDPRRVWQEPGDGERRRRSCPNRTRRRCRGLRSDGHSKIDAARPRAPAAREPTNVTVEVRTDRTGSAIRPVPALRPPAGVLKA